MSWDPLHGPGHNYSPQVFSLASSWTGPGVVHLSNDECQSNAHAALSVNGECRCSERRVKLNANMSKDHAGEGRCAERKNLGFGRDIH